MIHYAKHSSQVSSRQREATTSARSESIPHERDGGGGRAQTIVNASERQSEPEVAASARSFARLIQPAGEPWPGRRSESRLETTLKRFALSSALSFVDAASSFLRWKSCVGRQRAARAREEIGERRYGGDGARTATRKWT
jgi:hypothetical protein